MDNNAFIELLSLYNLMLLKDGMVATVQNDKDKILEINHKQKALGEIIKLFNDIIEESEKVNDDEYENWLETAK